MKPHRAAVVLGLILALLAQYGAVIHLLWQCCCHGSGSGAGSGGGGVAAAAAGVAAAAGPAAVGGSGSWLQCAVALLVRTSLKLILLDPSWLCTMRSIPSSDCSGPVDLLVA